MDALSRLLALPAAEKRKLGIEHTPSEIAQQPETWLGTVALCRSQRTGLQAFLAARSGAPVLLAGAGTSDFIGRALERLLERRWRTTVRAVASTELLTGLDDWLDASKPALCISFSRSGDSSEGVAVIQEAMRRFPRVAHLIVTCNADGAMARLAHGRQDAYALVLDPATNDRGLAMTSSYTNMVVAGQALGFLDNLDSYGATVNKMATAAAEFLPHAADAAARLVDKGFQRVCFLGSGALGATATESALKVQELTAGRIFTMSQSFLGLRHGPLSFIDRKTLVAGYLASDERTRRYELDLLRELKDKQLGATIVATGFAVKVDVAGIADVALDFGSSSIPDSLRPPLDVILGQLLGLFSSLKEGLQPDTPSPTGAISRVVSHVTIHAAQPVPEVQ